MERYRLTYDVPTIGALPFRITNFRIHPDHKQIISIRLPQDFLGLYLNMGEAFDYTGAKTSPGVFHHHQFNFIYMPAGDYAVTLPSGLHHSLAIQLSLLETMRWSKDIPPLQFFVKTLNGKKSKFLGQKHIFFSGRLKEELDRLLYSMWKDEYLATLDISVTSFNIFLRCMSEIANVLQPVSENHRSADDKKIAEAAKYLTDNVGTNISVEALAIKFDMSQRTLQKRFQEHYGETVHEYILRYRMDQAKILLMDRTKSIKNIAFVLGYKYVENFTTAYKKRFNQSPRDARA